MREHIEGQKTDEEVEGLRVVAPESPSAALTAFSRNRTHLLSIGCCSVRSIVDYLIMGWFAPMIRIRFKRRR